MGKRNILLVDGETFLAKDIRELLEQEARHLVVKLAGGQPGEALLTEQDGEATVQRPLDEDLLLDAAAVVFAGERESVNRAQQLLERLGEKPVLIDLTYALEEHPHARLVASRALPEEYAQLPSSSVYVIPHPAATVLAVFLRRLHRRFPIQRSVILVLEPASERGKRGIDELQQQTINLLSFKSLPEKVFDAQLTFNVLARYGQAAPEKLEDIEARLERHLASLLSLAPGVPMPSLRLVQAPVFHGYSISAWVEFEEFPGVPSLEKALRGDYVEVRTARQEAPSNVGVAGQPGLTVGVIEPDRNQSRAAWFWIVADNHRVSAENAVDLLKRLFPQEEPS